MVLSLIHHHIRRLNLILAAQGADNISFLSKITGSEQIQHCNEYNKSLFFCQNSKPVAMTK